MRVHGEVSWTDWGATATCVSPSALPCSDLSTVSASGTISACASIYRDDSDDVCTRDNEIQWDSTNIVSDSSHFLRTTTCTNLRVRQSFSAYTLPYKESGPRSSIEHSDEEGSDGRAELNVFFT